MRIVIVGCGRVGSELAVRLDRAGHEVTVIDEAGASFRNLHPDFRGRTVQGSVLSREVLERAAISEADGFAAVTNSDTVNAVAAHVVGNVFRVPNVVARNYATGWLPLHEAFGHPTVSSTAWGAQRIEARLAQGDMRLVGSAGNGEIELYELKVPAAWGGRPVSDLLPREHGRAVALTRRGGAVLVSDDLLLEADDELLVAVPPGTLVALRDRLARARSAEGSGCS
jgi:trk system potassium uptake protein TrkA